MRKKKSLYNIVGSLAAYIIAMIFTFITQGIIVKVLGIEYSGVNGLFTNILTMLSVAELGLGTTIIFKLYEPISKGDKDSIKSWLNYYKICYRYVALIVLVIGVVIIPFVPYIVGETTINENITLLYLIALIDTVLSYVMTYKRSLLYADQKNYIINFIHIGYVIFMNITQIIILYLTKNFYYFLEIKLVYRLLENIIINVYVDKKYPYIKEKANKISKNEKKDFSERIKAMILQKISFVINKGIDNITISLFLGVSAVGYYTNYNLIATTLCGIVFQMISGFSASVGNLLTEENEEKNYEIFKRINFINSFVTAICISGYLCCIRDFITIWLGSKYLLPLDVVVSFSIYIYSDSIRRSITIFKEAAGICKEDQMMYVFMATINLVTSIILCKFIGISGVIIGTALSYLFLIFYSYPKYIFKSVFKKSIKYYYSIISKNILIIIISCIFGFLITNIITIKNNIIEFLMLGIITMFITGLTFLLFNKDNEELKYFKKLIIKK